MRWIPQPDSPIGKFFLEFFSIEAPEAFAFLPEKVSNVFLERFLIFRLEVKQQQAESFAIDGCAQGGHKAGGE